MYKNEDTEDLRAEIYRLKKQLSEINCENHLLKVKVRKLQDEINKKNRQMDSLLDPKNFQFQKSNFHKIIYERSASFLLSMKEKNDELQKVLNDKDKIIIRLQNNLQTAKLYAPNFKSKNKKTELESKKLQTKSSSANSTQKKTNYEIFEADKNVSWKSPNLIRNESSQIETLPIELVSTKSNSNLTDQHESMSKDRLLSLIGNLKGNGCLCLSQNGANRASPTSSRKTNSPESDLDRFELLCESPHEEIQQLHLHFVEMLNEIDYLKSTITQLHDHQVKTESVLKETVGHTGKLRGPKESLKKPKKANKKKISTNGYKNNQLVRNIDSNVTKRNVTKDMSVVYKKNYKKPKEMFNKLTNTSDLDENCFKDDEEYDNDIKYIKKDNIFIIKKDITSQTEFEQNIQSSHIEINENKIDLNSIK